MSSILRSTEDFNFFLKKKRRESDHGEWDVSALPIRRGKLCATRSPRSTVADNVVEHLLPLTDSNIERYRCWCTIICTPQTYEGERGLAQRTNLL
jgi:hypothetical protein